MAPDLPREIVPILAATAELCAELNRVHEFDEFTHLLGRAAEVLDASGIVIWVAAPGASLLRPVLAHGYSPHALARMPRVPRTGDNAAAAAFRTGKLQIVLSRPGMSAGALAAPMLTPNGCIGALTAEIKNGGETSDGVQALASIFASQLAGVLADSVLQEQEDEVGDDTQVPRTASA
jgi:GAF domain-containing protein